MFRVAHFFPVAHMLWGFLILARPKVISMPTTTVANLVQGAVSFNFMAGFFLSQDESCQGSGWEYSNAQESVEESLNM